MNKYAGLGLGDLSWAGILATGGAGAVGGFLIDRYIRKKKDLSSNALWGLGGFGVGALGSVAWQYAQKAIEDKRIAEKGDVAKRDVTKKSPEDARALRESAIKRTHPGMTDEQAKELYAKQETDTGVVPPEQKEWDLTPGYGTAAGATIGTGMGLYGARKPASAAIESYAAGKDTAEQAAEKIVAQVDNAAKPGTNIKDPNKFRPVQSQLRQLGTNEVAVGKQPNGSIVVTTQNPGETVKPVVGKSGRIEYVNVYDAKNNLVDMRKVHGISPELRVYDKAGKVLQTGDVKVPLSRKTKFTILKNTAKASGRVSGGAVGGTLLGWGLDIVRNNAERIGSAMVDFGVKNIDPVLRHLGRQLSTGATEAASAAAGKIAPRY